MIQLRLHSNEPVNDKVKLLSFVAKDGADLPGYSPGAHIEFELDGIGLRSYSLIDFNHSSANDGKYRVAVQIEESGQGGSRHMHALANGSVVPASAPKNDFELVATDAPIVLIAGGIGITPLISFVAALSQAGKGFHLHYAARSYGAAAFSQQLADEHEQSVSFWYDDQDPINLSELVGGLASNTHVYCCGPVGMIEAVRTCCEDAGIANEQIHFELFSSPESDATDGAFEVEIASNGQVFTIPPDATIIEVLEEAGIDVMYDCKRGDCGICQTDVVEGIPDHKDVVLSKDEREGGKVMQICVSRAKSARLVLDL